VSPGLPAALEGGATITVAQPANGVRGQALVAVSDHVVHGGGDVGEHGGLLVGGCFVAPTMRERRPADEWHE
jgi:hypothetical protein